MVNLKGRENEFRNIAIELLRRFQNDVGEVILCVFTATIICHTTTILDLNQTNNIVSELSIMAKT